jgi:hypothetical protein
LRAEVFRDPRLDGCLSVLDDDLVDRIKDGFAQNAWVAKVNRVSKHFPASVKVDLTYRQPVCMVEVPGGALAVDAEGVVLPSEDFTPLEAKTRYPLLLGVDRKPPGMFGGRWGDARVIGGAEIAALFGQLWETFQLQRMEAFEADPATAQTGVATNGANQRSEPFFALFTRSGTRILWGHAPGASYLGEIPAAEKLARLKAYFDNNDSLDGPNHKAQELDVRTIRKPDH